MLTREGCRVRQDRLLQRMAETGSDRFISTNYRTVYYLTGSLVAAETPVIFALDGDGRSVLVTAGKDAALADELRPLELYSIRRSVDNPWRDAFRLLNDALDSRRAQRVVTERPDEPDERQLILGLRKRKEQDEIAEIRESLRLIAAAYDAGRAAVAPGVTELQVFNEMQAAVVRAAGTFVHLNGDFAAGERCIRGGGAPTDRAIREGDLFPLDLFPAPRLYFGDTCRTFAAGTPTDVQYRAQELVCEAMRLAEGMIRPGVRARDVYQAVKDHLDSRELAEKSFWHHAGHGIGHHGHEAPRIIPGSDDIFEENDVITLEPGIYTAALGGGIRIEDNYVVRADGPENLFAYPKEL